MYISWLGSGTLFIFHINSTSSQRSPITHNKKLFGGRITLHIPTVSYNYDLESDFWTSDDYFFQQTFVWLISKLLQAILLLQKICMGRFICRGTLPVGHVPFHAPFQPYTVVWVPSKNHYLLTKIPCRPPCTFIDGVFSIWFFEREQYSNKMQASWMKIDTIFDMATSSMPWEHTAVMAKGSGQNQFCNIGLIIINYGIEHDDASQLFHW